MKKTALPVALLAFILLACNTSTKTDSTATEKDSSTAAMPMPAHDDHDKFKDVKFDYATDPVCNMPVTAGVSDTAHYDGKVIGFCSPDCKTAFVADPKSYLSQLK